MTAVRRSKRYSASVLYESNGRDYLASVLGWSRQRLEDWLASEKVQQHLRLWYNVSIRGRQRFKDGLKWIDEGQDGYYYEQHGLQEDLLLSCLCDGEDEELEDNECTTTKFGDENILTCNWSTQRLWARTAWRIVQDNRGPNQAFEHAVAKHPVAVYSFVIDLLCLSFHSIAWRGSHSIWKQIILGSNKDPGQNSASELPREGTRRGVLKDIDLDAGDADGVIDDENVEVDIDSDAASFISSMAQDEGSDSDDDGSDFAEPQTPKSRSTSYELQTPGAPKKLKQRYCQSSEATHITHNDDNGQPDSLSGGKAQEARRPSLDIRLDSVITERGSALHYQVGRYENIIDAQAASSSRAFGPNKDDKKAASPCRSRKNRHKTDGSPDKDDHSRYQVTRSSAAARQRK